MHVVVGLGNPGSRYERTRHNIGRMLVEQFAESAKAPLTQTRFESRFAISRFAGEQQVLLAPETYMNLSGQAVWPALKFYKVEPVDLVVCYDDVDLPLGRIRIREKGGHGGHKGMRSIIDSIGRSDFVRIRLGVGRPAPSGDVSGHVLGTFSDEEQPVLDEVLKAGVSALRILLRQGTQRAMNRYNRWTAPSLASEDDD